MSSPFLSSGSLTLKTAQGNEMLEAIKIIFRTLPSILLPKYNKSSYWNFLINILLNLLQQDSSLLFYILFKRSSME